MLAADAVDNTRKRDDIDIDGGDSVVVVYTPFPPPTFLPPIVGYGIRKD